MSEREELMQLIRNEYDPRPDLGKADYPGFEWDDGAGRIADAIITDKTLLLRKHADEITALRAPSPAQEEPVAWTNEAQLGFLKEPGYRVVPMAMWAFQHSAHPIALYAIPAPLQPGRDEIAEYLYTKFCADPSIEWQDAPEKLKDVWRRYAGEIAALSGENSK